jgi:hypothetical protein
MSAYTAEEQLSYMIEKSTREKKDRVIKGIYEHMRDNYSKREIPYITHDAIKKAFRILDNYCKILHTGSVKKNVPNDIFHSSNMAIKNCSAYRMQQKVTDFFEANMTIDVFSFPDVDILKMMITPAEYDAALEKFVPDKTSTSSSPRSPRSPKEFIEGNMSDVDGGARKKCKSHKTRKSCKSCKSRKSRKNKKTAKRRGKQ